MKTLLTTVFLIGFNHFTSAQSSSNPYFPLEVGNRWDYYVEYHASGMYFYYDTLSIEIVGKELLPNDKQYFVYSDIYLLWPFSQTKYVRTEDSCVYFFRVEDSTDCFAFRFDLPTQSTYYDCGNHEFTIYNFGIIGLPILLILDEVQNQFPYEFSKKLGVTKYFSGGIIEINYNLYGCKISGQVFGNLIADIDQQQIISHIFSLDQNYPNPFNPSTKISWQSPVSGWQTLKVYDVLGNEVAILVDEYRSAGSYEIEFNPESSIKHPASGIYFYQLQAGDYLETKKMILLK